MPNCQELEPLVTAWIDGAATDGERQTVEAHLNACAACRRRAEAERSIRTLIRRRAGTFRTDVPPDLKERCRVLCSADERGTAAAQAPAAWRRGEGVARVLRLPIAATLVIALAGVLLYFLTASSTTTLAAQLTLDHIKCFGITGNPAARIQPDIVEAQLRERYGWNIDVPGDSASNRLQLLGGRRCLFGEGTMAHVLYRHNGSPLSLFMLPDKVQPSEIVEVMGHAAIIWAQNQRTYVLLGNEPRDEMEKIAGYIRNMVK